MRTKLISTVWLLCLSLVCQAGNVVNVLDYGVVPNSGINSVPSLKKAIEACRGMENPTLLFPKGRYDFWPSTLDIPNRYYSTMPVIPESTGMILTGIDNLTVDGCGSEFIFHGMMQVLEADFCSNLTVRGFSVDWDRPMISQCRIMAIAPDYVDVSIDRREYPYIVDRGHIRFIGEGWEETCHTSLLNYNNVYDKDTKEIKYNTWDYATNTLFARECQELDNGQLRFKGHIAPEVEVGDYVTIFHSYYTLFGLRFTNCRDVLVQDLTIYHAIGYGFSGERCENITFDNASMTVNKDKGRVFSIASDACNLTNCKGLAKFVNVNHNGHGDDWLNVHSAYAVVDSLVDDRTLVVTEEYQYTGPGDEVWFIDRKTSARAEVRTVESVEYLSSVKSEYQPFPVCRFRVRFTEPVPQRIGAGDIFENKTYACNLEVRNCTIGKTHRARGILFTTPGKALIEDNHFSNAGTAILINGDTDRWYEGGGCTDVTIRNNVFENCLTSGNRDGNRLQWGEAVITIMPSFNTVTCDDDTYHKHIYIENNTFKVFDAPIVFARSTSDLRFTGNEIVKTYDYKPYTWQKSAFLLDGCRQVVIKDNVWDAAYDTRLVQIKYMTGRDITVRDNGFKVETLPENFKTYLEW